MKTQTLIDLAGGSTKLANLLGITPGAISQWPEDAPQGRVWQLRVIRPAWFSDVPVEIPPDPPVPQRRASDAPHADE